MWKDSETKSDYLNFDCLIDAVESIAMDLKLIPSTIGVYGDWGSGQSSLMQMVEEKINTEHKNNIPNDKILLETDSSFTSNKISHVESLKIVNDFFESNGINSWENFLKLIGA